MPVTYAFDGRIVVVRLEHAYASAEFHDTFCQAAADPACPSNALLLLDARRSHSLPHRPVGELRATAAFLTTKCVRLGRRIAMVAEGDVAYGLLHPAQSTLHTGGVAAQAFRAAGPARAWLLTGTAASSADGAGVWWVVSEQLNPPRSGRWCLRFEANGVTREVGDFPLHWFRMEPPELRALGGLT